MTIGTIIALLALGGSLSAAIGTLLIKTFTVGRDIGEIKTNMARTARLASYVPQLHSDVAHLKRHLEISTPQLPTFYENGNGHSPKE